MTGRKSITLVLFSLLCTLANSQINAGKIVYERKTNLYKRFKGSDWARDYIKEGDKTKVEEFELLFNDSLSLFKPVESEYKEDFSWATSKNTVYQNRNSNKRLSIKEIWNENIYIEDSLFKRTWKITDSKRKICGYMCRKAVWELNDTTRIYAWYCNEIMPSIGPESFCGLPGTILGLATEDGGIIYFAKSIELSKPDPIALQPKKTKSKIYSAAELRAKFEKEYGKERWGREMIHNTFEVW